MTGWWTPVLLRKSRAEIYEAAAAAAVMLTCAYNFAVSPLVYCRLENSCSDDGTASMSTAQGMFSRTTAASCVVSTVALLYKYRAAMPAYAGNVAACEAYARTAATKLRGRRFLDAAYVVACLLVIVPVNVMRLVLTYRDQRGDMFVVTFIGFMYAQNMIVCLIETRFVSMCRALGAMFADVNSDLQRLLRDKQEADHHDGDGKIAEVAGPVYLADFYRPITVTDDGSLRSAANVAEVLRIRHRLVRDAAYVLNDLFGISMGASLFNLSVMALFDVYYEVFNFAGVNSRWPVFVYLWLLQYSLRFYMIVMTAHHTTKQAQKSKILITDINNRYLDDTTRDELLLFLNQVSSCATEFTAYDFFTLNTHLITSSIGAGITFLVILLQYHSSEE